MTEPAVTVLLPVRDGGVLLAEAIDSVLSQSLTALRLVVIDDGSTDATPEVTAEYACRDIRVELVRNERNKGRSRSLNEALERVETPYVARMDADDRSRPKRLERQVNFLERHPTIGLCGTWVRTFGEVDGAVWRLPKEPEKIRCELLFRSTLAHPSVMARTASLREPGLQYREDQHWAEDWDLWQRCAERFDLANVREVLLDYRVSAPTNLRAGSEISRRKRAELHGIIARALSRLGLDPSEHELELHRAIGFHDLSGAQLDELEDWLLRLEAANAQRNAYPRRAFREQVGREWFAVCYVLTSRGQSTWRRYRESPLRAWASPKLLEYAKFSYRRLLPAARTR